MKTDRYIAAIGRAMPKGWSMHFAWIDEGRPFVVAATDVPREPESDNYRMVHTIREARRLPAEVRS